MRSPTGDVRSLRDRPSEELALEAWFTSTKCSPLSEYGLALYFGGDFVVAEFLNKEFKKWFARWN